MNNNINVKETYNSTKLNNLVNSHKYDEAINYIDKFDFSSNPEFQNEMLSYKLDVESKKREYNALIKKYNGKVSEVNNIYDINNLTNYGALLNMAYSDTKSFDKNFSFEKTHPSAYKSFRWLDNGNTDKTISGMRFKLPKNQVGLFGIDWLVKDIDPKDLLNAKLKESGLSIDNISNNKCNIKEDNYYLYIDLNKNHNNYGAIMEIIGSIDAMYNRRKNKVIVNPITYNIETGSYEVGNNNINESKITDSSDIYSLDQPGINITNITPLTEWYNFITDEKNKQITNINDLFEDEEKITTIKTWSISELQKTANKKYVVSHIKSNVYFGDKEWYYKEGDEPFERNGDADDNKEIYDDFMNELKSRQWNEIEIGGGTIGGEVGILIQINPRADEDGKPKGKAKQMFIPGLLPELANIDGKKRTDIRASKELNNMDRFGSDYKYELANGNTVYIDNANIVHYIDANGNDFIDNSLDSRNKLYNELNKDYIKKLSMIEATKFVSANGSITNETAENFAKIIALNTGNELYPGVGIIDLYNNIISDSDIFNKRDEVLKDSKNKFSYEVYDKLNSIYEIYDYIIRELYNQYNLID